MIPAYVKIMNGELPDAPGVYFHYDGEGKLLYVGKATSLKKRVGSYFTKAHDARIGELVSKIRRIDYIQTPTVIEALVLEANQIKAHEPPYNVMLLDDKSFLYLCITNDEFPRPVLMRGLDLERLGIRPFERTLSASAKRKFIAVYGPFVSGRSLKTALKLIRRGIPWSICEPPTPPVPLLERGGAHHPEPRARLCFDAQLGKCPGVCTGAIDKKSYKKIVKYLMYFFEGKKTRIINSIRKDMETASKKGEFELAAKLRDELFALEHIQDVALITREDEASTLPLQDIDTGHINALGRIEAYDIAHISGTSSVAAMTVFENGKPAKDEYRKFRIKSFEGSDDVRAMEEIMRRRFSHDDWPRADLLVIDGGEGQVNRVREVLAELEIKVPVIGIAKGFDRKQDRLVFDQTNSDLRRVAEAFKETLQKVRDEAHRFAGSYHRVLRARTSGIPKRGRI
ncbi:MAG: UvrB/UvrC motif-containing protein [Patescibacteria group bacterium]|jgi:excinuclease ABC subunit C